jgi:hypothetical protein
VECVVGFFLELVWFSAACAKLSDTAASGMAVAHLSNERRFIIASPLLHVVMVLRLGFKTIAIKH